MFISIISFYLGMPKSAPCPFCALILYDETFEWEMWKVKFIRISKSQKLARKSQIPKKVIKLQVTYSNFNNNGKNTNETFM